MENWSYAELHYDFLENAPFTDTVRNGEGNPMFIAQDVLALGGGGGCDIEYYDEDGNMLMQEYTEY